MKSRHDVDIEAGHTDTWAIQEYRDRINSKGTKKANQRCGYCGEYGHTRRKCEKLQQDMDWYIMHHNVLVKVAHDYIVNSPVGIGSLFTTKESKWFGDDYKHFTEHLVLIDFTITKEIKRGQFPITGVFRNTREGWHHKMDIRPYVKNPSRGLRAACYTGYVPKLVAASTGIIPSSWVADNLVDIAKAKQVGFFRRVGRKNEDYRNFRFSKRADAKSYLESSRADKSSWRYGASIKELEMLDPKNIRAKMFEDFKSGE
tara:strand:- start:469 stop:1242 length:774 start_codon:yes stop_codon:yes gene_type:complete